jgi:hypothetical protein
LLLSATEAMPYGEGHPLIDGPPFGRRGLSVPHDSLVGVTTGSGVLG